MHEPGLHFAGRSEIAAAMQERFDATPTQSASVVALTYTLRVIALVAPVAFVVAAVPALKPIRSVFFGSVLAVLVVLVTWHVVTGWIGTVQALRGRGDNVLATFMVFFLGVSWALPRRGPKPSPQTMR